jgi:hypothetical protein
MEIPTNGNIINVIGVSPHFHSNLSRRVTRLENDNNELKNEWLCLMKM